MAASSGDDESIWPGYVDALTTMVMIMTLVMMILGIVVFGASQGISRQFLERVASAANVDAGTDVSTRKISDDLIAWIQRHADLGASPYLSPGEDRPRGGATQGASAIPDPGVTSRQFTTRGPLQADTVSNPSGPNVGPPMEDVTATSAVDKPQPFSMRPPGSEMAEPPGQGWPAAPLRPAGPRQTNDAVGWPSLPHPDHAPDPVEASRQPDAPRQYASLTPPPLQKNRAVDLGAAAMDPVEIVSRQRPDTETARAGARVGRDPGARPAITVRFEERATRLDAEALNQVRAVIADGVDFNGAGTITITGLAGVTGSTVSDARRTAYYRVIAIREVLIAAGIRPGALRMGVVDTASSGSDIVTVTAEK
jgi:hypothetical protein